MLTLAVMLPKPWTGTSRFAEALRLLPARHSLGDEWAVACPRIILNTCAVACSICFLCVCAETRFEEAQLRSRMLYVQRKAVSTGSIKAVPRKEGRGGLVRGTLWYNANPPEVEDKLTIEPRLKLDAGRLGSHGHCGSRLITRSP